MDPETAAILIVETDQATRELYRRELEPAYKVFSSKKPSMLSF